MKHSWQIKQEKAEIITGTGKLFPDHLGLIIWPKKLYLEINNLNPTTWMIKQCAVRNCCMTETWLLEIRLIVLWW